MRQENLETEKDSTKIIKGGGMIIYRTFWEEMKLHHYWIF